MRSHRFALVAIAILGGMTACSGEKKGDASTGNSAVLDLDISSTGAGDSVRFAELNGMQLTSGGALLANGNFVVADQGDKHLLIFDPKGKLVKTFGRAGNGPGEFNRVRWVARCAADSVYVWDVGNARISVFDHDGNLGREFHPAPSIWKIACNSAGELVGMTSPTFAPQPSGDTPEVYSTVLLFSAKGDTIARIDSVPAGRNRPMAAVTEIARGPHHVLVGTGDSAAIESFSPTGARDALLHVAIPSRVPTRPEYDAAIDSVYLGAVPRGAVFDRMRKIVADIPIPATPAIYRQLFADSLGNAWVVPAWPLDSAVFAYGVAPDGSSIGPIRFPNGVHVIEISGNKMLGWRRDPDGAEHIVLYHFRLPGR